MLAPSPHVAARLRAFDGPIVVTGAGGWLGHATLEMLDAALGDDVVHRVAAFASSARPMRLRSGKTIEVRPLDHLPREGPSRALLFHYAYLGKEKVAELGIERFVQTNRAINERVLRYCGGIAEGGVFFASSGAAKFAAGSPEDRDREPYGAEKIRDESRFLGLQSLKRAVCVSRIFNMTGPFINKLSEYAIATVLVDIANGGPIKLRANRRVLRSFVHVRDVVDLAMHLVLERNAPSEPFDVAGEEVVEIGELAQRAARLTGHPDIAIERPPLVPVSDDPYLGDWMTFYKMSRGAGVEPARLDRQILDTAEFLGAARSARS